MLDYDPRKSQWSAKKTQPSTKSTYFPKLTSLPTCITAQMLRQHINTNIQFKTVSRSCRCFCCGWCCYTITNRKYPRIDTTSTMTCCAACDDNWPSRSRKRCVCVCENVPKCVCVHMCVLPKKVVLEKWGMESSYLKYQQKVSAQICSYRYMPPWNLHAYYAGNIFNTLMGRCSFFGFNLK